MNQPPRLAAEELRADPRIQQAKQLLLDAVKTHQKTLTSIRPSQTERKQSYQELLSSFAEQRGSKLWYPYLGSGIGNGSLVELMDGSVKYDFITGIGPHFFGHSHPTLIAAGIDAAISNTVMQGHLQQNTDVVELSTALTKAVKMDHCFLTTSGAMANENALKIVFQKRFPAHRILAFDHGFAGRTIVLSHVTDKPSFREGLPSALPVDYVPFFDETQPDESIRRSVSALKEHLARYPKEHAVMIFELVQGENGFYPGTNEFFTALMTILKENNISILADEIQSFGRTPAICAFHHFGLEQYVDMVTIGKMTQICATLYKEDHRPRPGLLSQTFIGSTATIHASKAVLNELQSGKYFGPSGRNMKIYNHFSGNLQALSRKYPKRVQGPFGIGSMIAFTPFDGDIKKTTKLVHALFEAGVISFIAGTSPTRVRFLLPTAVVTDADIDAVTKIIETTLEQVEATL